ncbi:DMT family transporter [uncultured Ruminococcus sp.]|uniref:DMT family transporter n=1 Tax=uncultured Ruminococcus sp. TaxID=165186 RepID=UPI0025DC0385|nr:DMT family transporter [uncultured Ruminococcus sp.]
MFNADFFRRKTVIVFLASIVALLWGSAYPCVKIGYKLFSVAQDSLSSKILYAGIRFSIAGVIALILSAVMNKKLIFPTKQSSVYIILLAFFQTFLQYILFYVGIFHTAGVKSAILISTSYVVFMVVLSLIFFRNEKLDMKKSIGCILGIGGAVIALTADGGIDFSFSFSNEGCIMLSSLFFAAGSVISKKVPSEIDSVSLNGWQLLLGGITLTIVGLAGGGTVTPSGASAWLMMFYLAVISSFGFVIWMLLLRYNPTEEITVFNLLVPIIGTILSGIVLGEEFANLSNIAALICVCIGIYVVNSKKKQAAGKE